MNYLSKINIKKINLLIQEIDISKLAVILHQSKIKSQILKKVQLILYILTNLIL